MLKYGSLYTGLALSVLSGAFNYFMFTQIFSSIAPWVSGLAAGCIAGLMFLMLFKLNDKEYKNVWLLCMKVSVLTTIGAIFMSQVASSNSGVTVTARQAAMEYKKDNLDHDSTSQVTWVKNNRITTAQRARNEMDMRVDDYVLSAVELEEVRNGKALLMESLNKFPDGWGLVFLGLFSLIIALTLDFGAAACIRSYLEECEKEENRFSSGKSEVNRTKISPNSDNEGGRYDTGTAGAKGNRYFRVVDDIQAGSLQPAVSPIKQKHKCNQATARMYLAAMEEDGILTARTTKRGIEYQLVGA